MSYTVFLSHSSEDLDVAKRIDTLSKSIDVEMYLFERDPQLGITVSDKVKKEIQNSDSVLVLLTHSSQVSAYVHQEIGFAEGIGKLVIPFIFPGFNEKNLGMLQGREYVLFDPQSPNEANEHLLEFLKKKKNSKENANGILLGLGVLLLLAIVGGEK